ncbi:MAG: hypothetical protein HY233_00515 [Acidobacteriales bacterium]|nr:hypothetical protein [Terriglobales bacterium]
MASMSIGFAVFAIAAFVWASIDYNRFIKFWMVGPAPYTRRVRIVFRLFFLACVVGGVWQLADTMAASRKPVTFYLGALLFAAAWFVVFFLMLHFVEWMTERAG